MAKIDIGMEIDNLNTICRTGNLPTIIFSFNYQNERYKCFYCNCGDAITIAAENYTVGLNLPIESNKLDNYFNNDNYNKLKEIHLTLSTAIFCNKMLEKIRRLTLAEVQPITNVNISFICRKVIKSDEDKSIYFYSWGRHFNGDDAREDNLYKTRIFFGEEIYEICKKNNISSRWKDIPTKRSLDFLNRTKSKEDLLKL